MLLNCTTLAAVGVFVSGITFAAGEMTPQKVVEVYLAELDAHNPRVKPISDVAVTRSLPGYAFFAVLFIQHPVGTSSPKPLKSSNVLAVKGARVEPITDVVELETFVKANLRTIKDEDGRKAAAVAWVRLSQELHQDGMFTFRIPESEVTSDAKTASAKSIVEPVGGNRGQIFVELVFERGKLTQVREKAGVKAGMRPICQATKLLDPDPIVRQMAEQDILIMGRSCRAYLDEQRAKAGPALSQAIDRIWQRILEEDR